MRHRIGSGIAYEAARVPAFMRGQSPDDWTLKRRLRSLLLQTGAVIASYAPIKVGEHDVRL
jgi:hypothetical protein